MTDIQQGETPSLKRLSSHFPHNKRLFPSRKKIALVIKVGVLVGLLGIIFINVGEGLSTLPMGGSGDPPLQRIENTEQLYLQLANLYLQNNDFQNAFLINQVGMHEISSSSLLDSQKNEIIYKMNEPYFIKQEIKKWTRIAKEYPDYRDAWAELAYLNLKLGRGDEAKKYIGKVKKINPNWVYLAKFNL